MVFVVSVHVPADFLSSGLRYVEFLLREVSISCKLSLEHLLGLFISIAVFVANLSGLLSDSDEVFWVKVKVFLQNAPNVLFLESFAPARVNLNLVHAIAFVLQIHLTFYSKH